MLRTLFNLGRADLDAVLEESNSVRHISAVTYLQESALCDGLDAFRFGGEGTPATIKVLNLGAGSWEIPVRLLPFGHVMFSLDVELRGRTVERFIQGDGHHLPFHDACFDLVLCLEVIEHVQHADRFLSEVHRVLSPGGAFLVTAPFNQPYHEEPHDYRRLTRYGLKTILEANGFEVLTMSHRGSSLSLAHHLVSCIFLGILARFKIPRSLRYKLGQGILGPIGRMDLFSRPSAVNPHGVVASAQRKASCS